MSSSSTPELRNRRVLIIGVGGLGSPAALALAQAGVGHLTLIDDDVVDESNLHRQILFGDADLGQSKVQVAAARLRTLAPEVAIDALHERFEVANADALLARHDLVLDGSDNFATKFLASDRAMRLATPLIHAGVLRFAGQILPVVRGGPCVRCLFESEPSADDAPSCAQVGVLGAAAGVVGTYQAALGLALLRGEAIRPTLRIIDLARGLSREVAIQPRSDCPTCSPLTLDITGERCPMTYVRTKLRLEDLQPGEVLDVALVGDEPLRNVPRSLREDGHTIVSLESAAGRPHRFRVRKGHTT